MNDRRPVALITGAGSGIGRALAGQAAQAGFDLVLVGRRLEQLDETAQRIGRPDSRRIGADITTAEGRARIVDAVGESLDILVNNAGTLSVGRLTEMSDDDVSRMVETNLTAAVLLVRDMVPALAAARGRVVNIGSMFGIIAFPFFATYSATKFATRGLSDALRRELAEFGISVTYVAPRATRTPAQSHFDHLVEPFGMTLDDPETVARKAWSGISAGRSTIYPGLPERFFAGVQAFFPSLVDNALIGKAKTPGAQAALGHLSKQKEA